MLIKVRNQSGDAQVKDILDIDFDMSVEQIDSGNFVVRINNRLTSYEEFKVKEEAEEEMFRIGDARNREESSLEQW